MRFGCLGLYIRSLGDTVTQARHYGATVMLAEKYGLPLPPNLQRRMEEDDGGGAGRP